MPRSCAAFNSRASPRRPFPPWKLGGSSGRDGGRQGWGPHKALLTRPPPPPPPHAYCLPQELEASQAEQEGSEDDDPMAWAVSRFWKRRAMPLMPSRSFSRLQRWVGAVRE